MKKFMILVIATASLVTCTINRNYIKTAPSDQISVQNRISDTLYTAQSYLEMGLQSEEMNDSLSADYYFGRALEFVNIFREMNIDSADSLSNQVIQEVMLEYTRYLARTNGIEQDTLTAANVMKVLELLQDSISYNKQIDSTLVTIPNIMDEEEILSIPLELNQKVENVIRYFQGKGKKIFIKWLQRAGKYRPMITRILKEENVPPELLYLAMIESGFNPRAQSYARAVGLWQFIKSTGRAYGLKSSWWFDERQDPEKATRAAARHLKDLHEKFNENWYIAIAGYNYSPGRIEKRIKQYNVDDFWSLPRLPAQTRNYVPTFIASVIMAKDPEKYGFFVEPEAAIEYDTVLVKECVDLNVVAECVDTTYAVIRNMNPALLRFCTPPDLDSWILNIPKNSREKFLTNYAKVPKNQKVTWIRHQIRNGETLSEIAYHYGVGISEIKRMNKISGSLIRAGRSLVIPVAQIKNVSQPNINSYTSSSVTRSPVNNVPNHNKLIHIVKKNETLWDITIKYGIKIADLRRWNGLSTYSKIIQPGQKLNVWLPIESQLLAQVTPETPIQDVASEKIPKITDDGKTIIYTVRSGDTLWDIADHYGVNTQQIKKWNNRRNNLIRPGDLLKIIVPE